MKRIFLALLFISSVSFSQSLESLKVATKKLYQANYLLDFDGIAALCHPKITEAIGTENMYGKLEAHYENDAFRLRLQLEVIPFQYGTIKKIEDRSFCIITLSNPIRYTFNEKLTPEEAEIKKAWLERENDTKNVTFESKRNSFNVRRTTIFVAVADETTSNQWKFFNLDDENQSQVFRKLFPESIQKELGL